MAFGNPNKPVATPTAVPTPAPRATVPPTTPRAAAPVVTPTPKPSAPASKGLNPYELTKVLTGKVRLSYVKVFQPDEKDGKYSVSVILPKSSTRTIEAIARAIQVATENGKTSKWGGKIPAALDYAWHDGDVERPEDEAYAGAYYFNAKSSTAPGVVDSDGVAITNPADLYSGCYARVSVNFYPYDANGNRGIACGLNNIQKLEDGEPLGGRVSADADFAQPFDDEDADY